MYAEGPTNANISISMSVCLKVYDMMRLVYLSILLGGNKCW